MNNRFCAQLGHEKFLVTSKCEFEDCQLLNRQCCIQCINEGIHNHGKSDDEQIRLEQNNLKLEQQVSQQENDRINPIDLQNREYKVKQIDHAICYYFTAQISNNEKYIAYGGLNKILKIYEIKENKAIREIKFNRAVYVCQFTLDSSKLYVGCIYVSDYYPQDFAVVHGYDVRKNFKKMFSQNIKYGPIYNLITIQDKYMITSGYGKSIIKTDVQRKKQIFKLIGHNGSVYTMDQNQQFDLLICGFKDQSIKLWDTCRQRLIINREQAHSDQICQIQFINKQYVLSLDNQYNLFKWNIDLINNNLIKLWEFQDPNSILSYWSINQNQNLLLICENYIRIVDDNGQTIILIEHLFEEESLRLSQRQLDYGRYILIATNSIYYYKTRKNYVGFNQRL